MKSECVGPKIKLFETREHIIGSGDLVRIVVSDDHPFLKPVPLQGTVGELSSQSFILVEYFRGDGIHARIRYDAIDSLQIIEKAEDQPKVVASSIFIIHKEWLDSQATKHLRACANMTTNSALSFELQKWLNNVELENEREDD